MCFFASAHAPSGSPPPRKSSAPTVCRLREKPRVRQLSSSLHLVVGGMCRYDDQQICQRKRPLFRMWRSRKNEHDVLGATESPVRHGVSARPGPHTSAEVIAALKSEGITMSAPYLSQLRSGNRTNPSATTMTALANFFRIKPAYFTDDEYYEKLDKELTWLANMRDEGVRRIAARTVGALAGSPAGHRHQGRRAASSGTPRRLARRLRRGPFGNVRFLSQRNGRLALIQRAVLPCDLEDPFPVRIAFGLPEPAHAGELSLTGRLRYARGCAARRGSTSRSPSPGRRG